MIGKTNVNERNTRYAVGALNIGVSEERTFLPSEFQLDYFDSVSVTVPASNQLKEMCLGNTINFTPAEMGYDLTRVADYLLYKASMLRTIDVPPAVTYIGPYAFYDSGATSLRVDLPNLTSVGVNAFGSLQSITSAYVNLPLVTSCNNFLSGAANLRTADIVGIGKMGDNFLYGAGKLTGVTVPECCTNLGARCFNLSGSEYQSASLLHVYFCRHAVVDSSGAYTTSPTLLTTDSIGLRMLQRIKFHCPLDSLLAYRRQFATTGSENSYFLSRICVYCDCEVGDSLPASVTQIAAGYTGTYNIAWYTEKTHALSYSSSVANQAKRYFGLVTVVSETAV